MKRVLFTQLSAFNLLFLENGLGIGQYIPFKSSPIYFLQWWKLCFVLHTWKIKYSKLYGNNKEEGLIYISVSFFLSTSNWANTVIGQLYMCNWHLIGAYL